MEALIAQLIGGMAGGAAGGEAVKDADLGNLGNLIAGAVGGVGGGTLLNSVLGASAAAAGGVDIAALASQLVGGGVCRRNRPNRCRPPREQGAQESLSWDSEHF